MNTITKVDVPVAVLKDLVGRAIKGSPMINVIPLTCFMEVSSKDNKLTIRTTDNVNFVSVYANVNSPDFQFVTDSKKFTDLINKLTCENVSICIEDTKVTLQTNSAKYNFAIAVEDDGTAVNFPSRTFEADGTTMHVSANELKEVLSYNKVCKDDGKDSPSLFNYYFDNEQCLTTNLNKACRTAIKLSDRPILLSPVVLDLISAVNDEEYGLDISQDDKNIMFSSTKGTVIAKKSVQADLEAFPAAALNVAFSNNMSYNMVLNRTLMLNALDRMIVFSNPLDQNVLTLEFAKDGVTIISEETESSEKINYVSIDNSQDFDIVTLKLSGSCLKQQLTAYAKEQINISIMENVGIKMVCDDIILMLGVVRQEQITY